ncbi:hypothetical protein TNCV_3681111 [Trichonephila clavipes]|uniref:Uncharacterized protein n=1 Tax=Trichonephila clavipes TaxID=2585209 RepID=A0A8X6RCE3_TRICX|nr:hypothetical protein TNCV_3681111 [Trichonephila clavipes]
MAFFFLYATCSAPVGPSTITWVMVTARKLTTSFLRRFLCLEWCYSRSLWLPADLHSLVFGSIPTYDACLINPQVEEVGLMFPMNLDFAWKYSQYF